MTEKPNPEDEVWNYEVAYWRYAEAADLDNLMSLWHENGIGWPNNQPTPVNREGARQHVAEAFEALQLESISIDVKPLSVHIYGGIGITYFEKRSTVTTKDGIKVTEHDRATHTWLRTDKSWKIIGGMEAPLTTPQTV
jgi:ketosteroid isomerase-like protein